MECHSGRPSAKLGSLGMSAETPESTGNELLVVFLVVLAQAPR